MAQEILRNQSVMARQTIRCKNLAVAVPASGNTTILEVNGLSGLVRGFFHFLNTGFVLDAFIVQARPHPEAAYVNLLSVAADYTTPRGICYGASGDLTTLASGATLGWLFLDVTSLESIKLLASANGGQTAIDVYGNLSS